MKLNRMTPCQNIEIWSPKWSTRTVLVAKWKVGQHNKLTFTKAKSLPGTYYLSGATITACPITDNGKAAMYAVPLDKLEPLEYE